MTDQEYIDLHYITGGRMNKKTKPEEPRLTPGEQVAAVVIGALVACVSLLALVAQIGLFK